MRGKENIIGLLESSEELYNSTDMRKMSILLKNYLELALLSVMELGNCFQF